MYVNVYNTFQVLVEYKYSLIMDPAIRIYQDSGNISLQPSAISTDSVKINLSLVMMR